MTYFASPTRGGLPARALPGLDLDGRSLLLRLPGLRRGRVPRSGQDAGGRRSTADTRTFDPDQAALRRVQAFLGKYIPSALGPIIYTKTCLYTLTPDRDFVLDAVPGHPNALIAIGGGHGFKFASLIGQILAELAIDGLAAHDLEPFRIDRAILQLVNPPQNYMV